MAEIVIACYRPKEGQQETLERLVREHVPALHELGMVTDREPVCMRASDGVVVEVFEWVSREIIEAAHEHPEVQKIWAAFAACSDFLPLAAVSGSEQPFTGFAPL